MSLSHRRTRQERYRLGFGSTGSGTAARTAALRGNVVHSLQSLPQMRATWPHRPGRGAYHAIALSNITSRFPSPVGAVHSWPDFCRTVRASPLVPTVLQHIGLKALAPRLPRGFASEETHDGATRLCRGGGKW